MKNHINNDSGLCKKCGGEMMLGIAMMSTFVGIPDFPGGNVITMSTGGLGKMIPVSKCSRCGWSVTI